MMKLAAISLAATAALGLSGPAIADDHGDKNKAAYKAQSPEVIERNRQGKATKVRIDGKEVAVCMSETQDSCINPRAAGLNWGDRPLEYFPENRG